MPGREGIGARRDVGEVERPERRPRRGDGKRRQAPRVSGGSDSVVAEGQEAETRGAGKVSFGSQAVLAARSSLFMKKL